LRGLKLAGTGFGPFLVSPRLDGTRSTLGVHCILGHRHCDATDWGVRLRDQGRGQPHSRPSSPTSTLRYMSAS